MDMAFKAYYIGRLRHSGTTIDSDEPVEYRVDNERGIGWVWNWHGSRSS